MISSPTPLAKSYAAAVAQRIICGRFARALVPGAMFNGKLDAKSVAETILEGPPTASPSNKSAPAEHRAELSEQTFLRAWNLKCRLRPDSVKAMIGFAPERLHVLRRFARIENLCDDDFRDSDFVALFLASLWTLEKSPESFEPKNIAKILGVRGLRWAPQGDAINVPAMDFPFDERDARAMALRAFQTAEDRDCAMERMRKSMGHIRLPIRREILSALPHGDSVQDLRYMLALLTDNGQLPESVAARWAIDFATCIFANQAVLVGEHSKAMPIDKDRARFVLHCAEVLFEDSIQQTPAIALEIAGIAGRPESIDDQVRVNSLQMNLAKVRIQFQRFLLGSSLDSSWLLTIWDRACVFRACRAGISRHAGLQFHAHVGLREGDGVTVTEGYG